MNKTVIARKSRRRRANTEQPLSEFSRGLTAPVIEPGQTETIEQFLARGGQIMRCPTRPASGVPSAQMIYVDGQGIPTHNQSGDYVPSFVCDAPTYEAAQREAPDPEDDGSTAYWREYEQMSVPRAVRPLPDRSVSRRYEGDEE